MTRDRVEGNVGGDILGVVITIGLFTAMALTTLAFGAAVPWGMAALGMIVIVLLLVWAVKCTTERRIFLVIPAIVWPMALLLGYGVMQSVSIPDDAGRRWSISMDIEATRLVIEVGFMLLLATILAASMLSTHERLRWFQNFIVVFGLGLAVFGLIQHFTWNGKFYWILEPLTTPSSAFGPFMNHNHFAGYLEMIVPIPLALVITRAVQGERSLLYLFAAILMSVATIVSLSRGGMVSLGTGILFVIIFGLRPSMMRNVSIGSFRFPLFLTRVLATVILILTIGAGVIWVGGDAVINRMEKTDFSGTLRSSDPGKETFFQSRGWIWNDTMAMIKDNWVTGVGLGAYQTAYTLYSDRDGSLIVGQAHNDYLQAVADGGLIGAIAVIAFLVLLIRSFITALRHHDPMVASLALGCGGGLFAMMIHSLFDFNLQMPSNALLFLVLAAIVSNTARSVTHRRVSRAMADKLSGHRPAAYEMEVWS